MQNNIQLAKVILSKNIKVLYGIFGVIELSGYFPPYSFLNEFFEVGNDPCDQDGRMEAWNSFVLSNDEYQEILKWWLSSHPNTVVNDLGVKSWSDWVQEILEL